MSSNKLYLIGGGILLALAVVVLWFFGMSKDVSEDSLMFKRDYEAYNEQSTYEKISIDKSNKAKYIDIKGLIDTLDRGTALIFIGMPTDHKSRLLAETLTNLTENSELESFSYLDITNLQNEYKVDNDELIKSKEASSDYYELLNKLDKYLDYYEIAKDNKKYKATEKYINVPMLIGVNDGEITDVLKEKFEEVDIESLITDILKNNAVCDETC